jgi:hypothetical protein
VFVCPVIPHRWYALLSATILAQLRYQMQPSPILSRASSASSSRNSTPDVCKQTGWMAPKRHRCVTMRVVRTGSKGAARDEHYRYHVAAATTAKFAVEALRFTILIFVVRERAGMAELHVVSALRNKRAELAGMVGQLEQQLARQRTNLAHLDATMRLFDPEIRPQEIRAKQRRARSVWFRQGECLRRIYDELRNAAQPLTTRDLAERIMRAKAVPASDDRSRELIQKTILGSLNRAKETIARVEAAGVVSWRLV